MSLIYLSLSVRTTILFPQTLKTRLEFSNNQTKTSSSVSKRSYCEVYFLSVRFAVWYLTKWHGRKCDETFWKLYEPSIYFTNSFKYRSESSPNPFSEFRRISANFAYPKTLSVWFLKPQNKCMHKLCGLHCSR